MAFSLSISWCQDGGTLEVLGRLMNQSLGETYPNKETTKYGYVLYVIHLAFFILPSYLSLIMYAYNLAPPPSPQCRHIYQPMMESLIFVARHLDDTDRRRDLLLKTLQLFIQQGIVAKSASDTAQSSHKVRCCQEWVWFVGVV